MNKKLLTITIHVAFWAGFFLLPIVFFPRPRDVEFQFTQSMIWRFVGIDSYLLIFYYLNTHFLIPRLLTKRKWVWYCIIIICALLLFLFINRLFEEVIHSEMPAPLRQKVQRRHRPFLYPFTGSSAIFFLVLTVSTCSRVIQEWLGIESKRQEIENEKLTTELSFLKSQINPHFLFNTLNNIYSLAIAKSEATADAVLKLSAIMRYVLSQTKYDMVALDKEIEFIKQYIELQKVRLTDKVTIELNIIGDTAKKQIAPLLLMPFVENAFKYGVSTKESSKLWFEVKANGNGIYFSSQNAIVSNSNNGENTGIGLKNTKRRLELLYPEKHTLFVTQENNQFNVKLILLN